MSTFSSWKNGRNRICSDNSKVKKSPYVNAGFTYFGRSLSPYNIAKKIHRSSRFDLTNNFDFFCQNSLDSIFSSFSMSQFCLRFDMAMLAPEVLFFVQVVQDNSEDSDPAASGVLRALRARRLVRLVRVARLMRFRKVMTLVKKFNFYKNLRSRKPPQKNKKVSGVEG